MHEVRKEILLSQLGLLITQNNHNLNHINRNFDLFDSILLHLKKSESDSILIFLFSVFDLNQIL